MGSMLMGENNPDMMMPDLSRGNGKPANYGGGVTRRGHCRSRFSW